MAPTVTQRDDHEMPDPGIADQPSSTTGADVIENPPPAQSPMNYIGEGATPLMYACQQGREKEVKGILVKKPQAVRERDRTSKSPLHYCAENVSLSCAEMVLEAAPDLLDARDEDGYTALHLAVIAGNRQLIKMLLSKNADVNSLDNERHSVVHWATVCGEVEALELVLDAGAKPSTPDIHGGYPIHYAAQMCGPNSEMGNDVRFGLAVLRKLLARGVEVNVTDRDGRQPILWAASAGSADAILALVNAGANVEADDKDGLTALHCAASRGHTDCLETLISLCGAEIDVIDSNGCTALFYSVTLGHADSTQLLLGFGAEPNRQDRKGRTPAHCGAAKGQLETLRILATHGANLWARNVKGDYPLHEAVASGRKELVRWLLTQRPDAINSPNNDGRCPLHIAAINNNVEMCKIVLDNQALLNPVMRTGKGQLMTPLDAALHRGNRGCAKYLQLHGGVPASKLTDQAAKLKGGNRRVAMSETHSEHNFPTPELGYSLAPGGGTSILSISPVPDHALMMNEERMRKADQRAMQVRLNDDVAIRHVERIDAPIICRHHCFIDDSSEDEIRWRRRRRRMRERRVDSSKYSDGEQERRRRRRKRREQYSDSDSKDNSLRRRRRRRAKTEDEKSDEDSGREVRRRWMGSKRVDSEELEDYEAGHRRRSQKYRVSRSKKGKRRAQSDEDESEEDVRAEKPSRSKSKSRSTKQNIEESEDEESEVSGESSEEEMEKKIGATKFGQTKKKSKSNEKSKVDGSSETKATSQRKDKLGKDLSSKGSENKDEKVGKTRIPKRESIVRSKSESRKPITVKDRLEKSEEKGKGRRINQLTSEKSKESSKSRNESPMKAPRKFVKRTSDGKIVKSAILAVEEIIVNDGEEVVKRRYERQLGNQHISDDDQEIMENTQTVVTAQVHHADGSVSGESREVAVESESVQEGSEEQNRQSVEQTEEDISDVSAKTTQERPISGKESRVDATQEVANEASDMNATSANEEESPASGDVEGECLEVIDEADQGKIETTMENEFNEKTEEIEKQTLENQIEKHELKEGDMEPEVKDEEEINDAKLKAVNEMEQDEEISKEEATNEIEKDEAESKEQRIEEDGDEKVEAECKEKEEEEETDEKTSDEVNENCLDENENQFFRERDESVIDVGIDEAAPLPTEEEVALGRMSADPGLGLSPEDGSAELESLLDQEGDAARQAGGGARSASAMTTPIEHDESRSGASTARSHSQSRSRSQNGDSSMHLDSGFEPSPRRGKSGKEGLGRGGKRRGRIPRLCRTDDEDRPAISTVSVTQAVQNSMRKYQLERRIFQELLELKRLQIRSGRANEQLLVKRLVDDYRKAGLIVGLRQYDGVYTYKNFEKYLYDQLRLLQSSERKLIPRIKSSDDLDKLTKALKNARLSPLNDEVPDNPIFCTHSTHRCHHAAHAYTGVPCAAYITKPNHHAMPKGNHIASSRGFLPRIDSKTNRVTGVSKPLRYVDPSRPVTLELSHGNEKQVISLPTERLDKNKRYYVTFTIKGGPDKKKEVVDNKEEETVRQKSF